MGETLLRTHRDASQQDSSYLRNHPFPRLVLAFSAPQHLEHLVVGHRLHLGNRRTTRKGVTQVCTDSRNVPHGLCSYGWGIVHNTSCKFHEKEHAKYLTITPLFAVLPSSEIRSKYSIFEIGWRTGTHDGDVHSLGGKKKIHRIISRPEIGKKGHPERLFWASRLPKMA